jgi:hypothetical protein
VTENLKPAPADKWTVERKARILAEASSLSGEELTAYLEREGVKLAEYSVGASRSKKAGGLRNRQRSASAVWSGSWLAKRRLLPRQQRSSFSKKSGDLVLGGRGRRHGRDEREVILAAISAAQMSGTGGRWSGSGDSGAND